MALSSLPQSMFTIRPFIFWNSLLKSRRSYNAHLAHFDRTFFSDSSTTSLIVGIVVGLGSALLLGLVAIVCCYRTKRFCFASRSIILWIYSNLREVVETIIFKQSSVGLATKSFSNGDIEKRWGQYSSLLLALYGKFKCVCYKKLN